MEFGRQTVRGEVIAVGDGGIQVRLDTDEVAVVTSGETTALFTGYRGDFLVEAAAIDGRLAVSLIESTEPEEEPTSFDQEFDELQGALQSRRAPLPRREAFVPSHTLDEERIEGWLKRVDGMLAQLRKRRAKRLSEQMNDNT